MALTEATINKIKVLIYENKKEEAQAVLMTEAGLSEEEANSYLNRLTESLSDTPGKEDKPKSNKTAALIVLGVGLLMWALAIYFYVDKNNQLENSYLATGEVVDFILGEGFTPVISYEIDGKVYRYISSVSSNPPAFELNEVVEIYINKDNPNDIIINSFANKWLLATIFASFGLVLDLIGILLMKLKSSGHRSDIDFLDPDKDRLSQFDD